MNEKARDLKYKTVLKVCDTCNGEFYITPSDNKRGRGKFCSMKCHRPNACLVNGNFFSQPSVEMAYVLGLVYADGYIIKPRKEHKVRLAIKSIDLDLLEMVNNLTQSTAKIYDLGLTQGGNLHYRVEWSHPQILKDIEYWGVHPNKTFTVKFPLHLPEPYWADFIRGLFDGDGCIHFSKDARRKSSYKRQFNLLGTKELLSPIPKFLGLENNITPQKNIYKLVYQNINSIETIYSKIYYKEDIPCLQRKKLLFQNCISSKEEKIIVEPFTRGGLLVSGYERERVFYSKSAL